MSDSLDALLATLVVVSLAGGAIWNTRNRRPAWRTKLYLAVLLAFGVMGYNIKLSGKENERRHVERLQNARDALNAREKQRPLP